MPVTRCPNGKWRIGSGPCVYKSKESAESAYRGYLYYKGASENLEAMPDWMRNLFDQRVELAQEWVGYYWEAIENGFLDCLPYAWVKFHQRYARSKTEGVWVEYGVKGRSGHWGHKSQPGHRGGSLPKDGQASLPFDTPGSPPEMKAPEASPAGLAKLLDIIKNTKEGVYRSVLIPADKVIPVSSPEAIASVSEHISRTLKDIPEEWLDGLKGIYFLENHRSADVGEYWLFEEWVTIDLYDYQKYGITGIGGLKTASGEEEKVTDIRHIGAVLMHELGHHVWARLLKDEHVKFFQDLRDEAQRDPVSFKVPRAYARNSRDEFFCVNLEAYVMGNRQYLDDRVLKWFDTYFNPENGKYAVHREGDWLRRD